MIPKQFFVNIIGLNINFQLLKLIKCNGDYTNFLILKIVKSV